MNKDIQESNPYSGEFILEQLQRFGSDVNRKHEVSFWLYFPNEDSAQRASRRAASTGLKPEVSPPLKDSDDSLWLCLLYCPHVHDEGLLDGISQFCMDLASEFDGKYDGWEASLELEDGEKPTMPSNVTAHTSRGAASEAVQG